MERVITSNAGASVTRRWFIKLSLAAAALIGMGDRFFSEDALAQKHPPGWPLADEPVAATLKRLFGQRQIQSGDGKIKLDLPAIAEDGGNVAISVEATLPVSGTPRASHIYIISDKNRRPMLAKFSFGENAGRAAVSTSIRLATSTDVRAVIEMSDGALYAVGKPVRVTISGCDLPPAS